MIEMPDKERFEKKGEYGLTTNEFLERCQLKVICSDTYIWDRAPLSVAQNESKIRKDRDTYVMR